MRQEGIVLRKWQREADDRIVGCAKDGLKSSLVCACPGAGKTICAVHIGRSLLREFPECEAVFVVTSSLEIKEGWMKTAARLGIELRELKDESELERMVLPGLGPVWYVISYQTLVNLAERIARFVRATRAIAILDEIHHTAAPTAVRSGNAWGEAVKVAFADALHVACTTGTAFRGDTTNPIAFVRYNQEGEAVPTYSYSYEQAIRDGVCRPIEFICHDGDIQWRDRKSGRVFAHDFMAELNERQARNRLRASVMLQGNFPVRMLEEATQKLSEIRCRRGVDATAGGLVVAMNSEHAMEVAHTLAAITGKAPIVVHSKIDDAQGLIARYRESGDEWLVGINMLSEGVDIPRLRVGVYMSNIRAPLYFHQFCGRFARVQQGRPEDCDHDSFQRSYVFLPRDSELVDIAKKIELERCHALGEDPTLSLGGRRGGGGPRRSGLEVDESDSAPEDFLASGFRASAGCLAKWRSVINECRSKRAAYAAYSDTEMLKRLVDFGRIPADEVF